MDARHLVILALGALLSAGCPGKSPTCPALPGCEATTEVCCDQARLCRQQICEGVSWVCHRGGEGAFFWDHVACAVDRGADRAADDQPRDRPAGDQRREAPPTDSCACVAPATRPCGNCGKGTSTCAACSWGPCQAEPCAQGSTQPCPNGCGARSCSAACSWGPCSRSGEAVIPSTDLCYSSNHCGAGNGRCVQCWMVCDADGNLHKDTWCATACTTCGPANPDC